MKILLLIPLIALALLTTACASTDSFNRMAANLTHDAIVATETNRCSQHAAPCLSDEQFKAANLELNKVSVAGREYTKLRLAGSATVKDASTFLSAVAEEVAILSKTFPDGAVGQVLAKLIELQQRANKLLGGK